MKRKRKTSDYFQRVVPIDSSVISLFHLPFQNVGMNVVTAIGDVSGIKGLYSRKYMWYFCESCLSLHRRLRILTLL